MNTDVTVTDVEDRQRFEARIDGLLAGVVTYTRTDATVAYLHTQVLEGFEGKGIGGILAEEALDDARRRGLKVDPQCPFIASWIAKNPGYQDLVVPGGA